MARWQLKVSHYLPVPGTTWEYSEISRTTGRPVRQKFNVPMLLDINDPSLWTEVITGPDGKPLDGVINVCYEGKGQGRDVIFTGPPTPDMEPLDDEAKAITKEASKKWSHPIEDLPATGVGVSHVENIIAGFQRQMSELQAGNGKATGVSVGGVSKEEFDDLKTQLAELMKQNTMLMSKLMEPKADRRV